MNCSQKLEKIRKILKDREPGTEDFFKCFSVLIPIVEIKDKLYVLYEVRAFNLCRQPGEVCFPGGELEEGENPMECALRETSEEIGIEPNKIEVINKLDTIYTYSNFAMHSYVGVVDGDALDNIRINTNEVDHVFLVPLSKLTNTIPEIYTAKINPDVQKDFPYEKVTGGDGYNWRTGEIPIPVYAIEGEIIWGLTGRITGRFVEAIKDIY